MKQQVLAVGFVIFLCLAAFLSYLIASPLFGLGVSSGAAMFQDLEPEPMLPHEWHLAVPRFPQFCLGLCTNPEFPQ